MASVDRPRDNWCRATRTSRKGGAPLAGAKSLRTPYFGPWAGRRMDRMFSSTPACRPHLGLQPIFSAASESSETTAAAVELSGFPTTGKSSPRCRLPFQTERRVPLTDGRARRFPLPRDAIPSRERGVASRLCRLRLARMVISASPLVLVHGCNMGKPEIILSWWDRDIDRGGRPIRADARSAAHEVWTEACRRTEALLADRAQAAELMEDSVAQVSRYLDRIGALKSSPKNGLLLLAFSRALGRLAARSRRLQLAGGSVELSTRIVDDGWSRQVDAQLELENVVRKLSERNGTVLALRRAGYNWEEVAEKFGTSVTRIRNGFWREVREVARELRGAPARKAAQTGTSPEPLRKRKDRRLLI